jgi:hypothetical protein
VLIIIILIYLFLSSPSYAQSPTIDPSITPSLTPTTIPTPTTTLIPTPTSSVAKNPSTGIYLNEFMPNPSTVYEWVEIYNDNNFEVELTGWKIGDSTINTKSVPDLTIPAHSVKAVDIGSGFLNNSTDDVKLINDKGATVDTYTYSKISEDGYGWSKVNGSWCFAVLSKGQGNNSCASPTSSPTQTPTSTPTSTNTPTPTKKPTPTIDLNKYPTTTPPVPVIEPTGTDEEMQILGESANIEETTLEPTSNLKLEDNNKKTKSNNILPGIFIGVGGLMLLTPLIIAKLKHEKQ